MPDNSIEILGRSGIRYAEGGRSAHIDSEMLIGNPACVLYVSSLKKWDDGTDVDDVSRNRIVENVRRFFELQGFDIELE